MSQQADVRSLEQLQLFLQKLQKFRQDLLKEVEALELEVRRASDWLQRDVLAYWSAESSRAQHAYSEAQQSLSRCMSYVREDERRPCTEQKKQVQVTKGRRELCEEKLRTAKAAVAQWEREEVALQTKLARCRDLADAEVVIAIHQLKLHLERLEEYAGLRSSAAPRAATSTSAADRSDPPMPPGGRDDISSSQ